MTNDLFDSLVNAAEELGWCCRVYDGDAELQKHSPAGEDFIVSIDDIDDMVSCVAKYAEDFDADEHAAFWVEHRGSTSGVPSSIRALIDDADAIKAMLEELAEKLKEAEAEYFKKHEQVGVGET